MKSVKLPKIVSSLFVGMLFILFLLVSAFSSPLEGKSKQHKITGQAVAMDYSSQKNSHREISLQLKNTTLSNALHKLSRVANVGISFDYEDIPAKRITYTCNNKAFYTVLRDLLAGTNLVFTLSDDRKVVIIQDADNLQTGSITGQVTDAETREPLPGASIYVEETSKGSATNKEGKFMLADLKAGMYTIVATYVGYKDNKKKVLVEDGETVMVNFELEVALASIQEMVVTGYYSLPEERATGSFSHIDQEDLETINSLSVEDKLQGLVPGLLFEPNFNSDQSPTTERSRGLIIRGQSTLGDNSPLIVVDGFPVISSDGIDPWSTINPDNVKSVTVLKDAAAASIWGAQAANGVIVIETKEAEKTGRPSVNASIDYFTQPSPDLYDIPFASSRESVEIYKSLIMDGEHFDPLMQSFFKDQYELPEVIDVLVKMKTGEMSEAAGNQRLNELAQIDVRDEFSNLFFRNMESNTRVNLSYSNGTEYSRTRASIMTTNSNEYAIGDSEIKVIAKIKNEFQPTDWFTTNLGVNYTLSDEKNDGVGIRALQNIPQMSRIIDSEGNYAPMVRYDYPDLYYDIKTSMRRGLVEQYNLPYDWDWNLKREINNRDQTEETNNLRLNSRVTIDPIDQLAVDLFYQYERNHSLVSEYYNEESWYVRNTVNENARPDGSFPVPAGGMLYENQSNFTSHNGRVQVTYDDTFFEDHSLRVLGGMEIRKDYYEEIPYGYYGYDPQSLTHVSNINFEDEVNPKLTGEDEFRGAIPPIPTVANTSIFIDGRDDRFLSYYGNLGYSYDQRFDLTGSIRLDQTNLYGRAPSYRELPQWSIGAGWTISDESFYKINTLNYLKLRMSYGWNGHIDKSASPFISGTPWVDPVNQLEYAAVQSTPNPGLTWEKTANYNVGLDFAFLDDRIEGTVEAYLKKTRDVLSDVEVNPTYGFYSDEATLNNGNITNKGIEVDLSSLVIDKKITWQTGFNFSFNKNVARDVQTSTNTIADWAGLSQFNPVNGQPVDYIAVAEWAGYSDEGLPQVYYDGEIRDVTEINYSNADLEKLYNFVGRRSPKYFGSWSNTFSYKNFEFSFRLLYRFGHKFFKDTPPRNAMSDYTSFRNFFTFNSELLVDRWQSAADGETASMYSVKNDVNFLTSLTTGYLAKYNTSNLLDAGNVRLKNISFSYNLPPNFLGAIRRGQIQIQARNLGPIFLKNDEGLDPDFPKYSSSLYSAYYNVIRDRPTYSVNLRIGI